MRVILKKRLSLYIVALFDQLSFHSTEVLKELRFLSSEEVE